jgi:A/G-specific adenine glycosylase
MKSPTIALQTSFAFDLVRWYNVSHRDLPWRNTRDPYAIWLSEIMLQQTQVRTVIGYYYRFLERYPTIAALAVAPLDDVLKQWEGLGYYARCRNLHKAAQMIVESHSGQFPQSIETVEALPGIGRSTAGAILTFGYGQKHPLLDGNVKRVLSRLADIDTPIEQSATLKRLWSLSENLISETDSAYEYNQAIMELGATVCLPREPRCLLCPVQRHCQSFAAGTQYERPVKAASRQTPHFTIGVGVIWNGDKILIQQRPPEGLLGGLWEFPGGKHEPPERIEDTVRREIEEELGIQVRMGESIMQVKHAYSHFKITLHAYHCYYETGEVKPTSCQAWRWVSPEDLTDYAFPKANKTVLQQVVSDWYRQQQTS